MAVAYPLRTITHVYWNATSDWWHSQPVYSEGIHGFLYLPSAVFLYWPFQQLPTEVADHLWRALSTLLLTFAVLRTARLMNPSKPAWLAGCVLAVSIPTLSINLLRSQWELVMFALLLLAAVDIAQNKERRAGWILALALALKPLTLVPILLFGVLRPRILPSFLMGFALALILPFAHPDPSYVWGQYMAFPGKLFQASQPNYGKWFDLATGLSKLGAPLPEALLTPLRALGAVVTLAGAWLAQKRLDRQSAVFVTLFLALLYLALFNPRTEEGTFGNIAVMAALCAGSERALRGKGKGNGLLLLAVFLLSTHFFGCGFYKSTQQWIKQTVALGLVAYVGHLIASRKALVSSAAGK